MSAYQQRGLERLCETLCLTDEQPARRIELGRTHLRELPARRHKEVIKRRSLASPEPLNDQTVDLCHNRARDIAHAEHRSTTILCRGEAGIDLYMAEQLSARFLMLSLIHI